MWHFIDKKNGIEITGTREEIVKALNINTVYFEDRDEEELVDISRPSHWKRIIEEYHLTGNDKDE